VSSRAGRPDLPARELARQLRALPAPLYEFAVFDGRTTRRVWRRAQALRSVGWLAHRNRRGGHVYVRPATTACVLLDGLTADALAAIRGDGLAPAAVAETAPGALQAWFRLGRELGPRLAACAVEVLADRYGTDPGNADAARPGRAAGFGNRSAALVDSHGRYPAVLLTEARGRVTPKAEELVAAAEERMAEREARRTAAAGKRGAGGCGRSARGAEAFLTREIARTARRQGTGTDWSRAFGAAARRMALAGFGQAAVASALAACPCVGRRKGPRAEDYAQRTAAWAFGALRRRPR